MLNMPKIVDATSAVRAASDLPSLVNRRLIIPEPAPRAASKMEAAGDFFGVAKDIPVARGVATNRYVAISISISNSEDI